VAGASRNKRKLRKPKKKQVILSEDSNVENDSDNEDDNSEEEEEVASSDSDIVRKKKPKRKKQQSASSSESEEETGPRKRRRIRTQSDSEGKRFILNIEWGHLTSPLLERWRHLWNKLRPGLDSQRHKIHFCSKQGRITSMAIRVPTFSG
jgi:hypothetical protein